MRLMTLDLGPLVYAASRYGLRWALLAWIVTTAGQLIMGDGPHADIAETAYRMVTGIGLMALAWFGLLNVYYGVIKDFSVGQIVLTTAALGIGGYGGYVAFQVMPVAFFAAAVACLVAGEAAIGGWLWRGAKRAARRDTAPPLHEPTLRGKGSVLATGPDGVHMVPRHETGKNTPAERFERRLIRHIERALSVEAISMAGTNASYWRFRLPNGGQVVELIVIGPGCNTALKLRDGERWLLRIREYKPCQFTEWLRQHFGADAQGVTRNLGASLQTQFASSMLTDENRFFNAGIPWVSQEEKEEEAYWAARRGHGPVILHVWPSRTADLSEGEENPPAPSIAKPTMH
mgnify:CR=1 FL=1